MLRLIANGVPTRETTAVARSASTGSGFEDEELTGPSPDDLDALWAWICGAIDHGLTLRKAVLQELVAEVIIESRRAIRPPPGFSS